MDRGRVFYAEVADTLKDEYGITPKYITARNPQGNSMIERVHQTIGNMISTIDLIGLRKPSEDEDEDKLSTTRDKWEGLLSAVAYAV